MIELLKRIRQAFIELMFKPAHIAIVGMVGTYTMIWGGWVVMPVWDVFTSADLYSNMLGIAPEVSWGGTAVLAGAVATYGAIQHSYIWTRIGGASLFWFWLVIGIMYLTSDWHNTGGITALFFAAYGAYIFINSKLNKDLYRYEDRNIKKKYE